MPKPFLLISAQYGDMWGRPVIWPMQREINTLSERLLFKEYVSEVEQVGIVLRVNGVHQSFPEVGPCRLRRNLKGRLVTIDIVIPEEKWVGKPRSEVCAHIIDQVGVALSMVMSRLTKDGVQIDSSLLADFANLKEDYLAFFHDL